MAAVKIPISLTIILILSLSVHSALGDKPTETTTPTHGCFGVPRTNFNFLPAKTGTLGTLCARLHEEEVKDDKPTNTNHNWFGSIKKSPECGVCCARGDGSDTVHYSFIPLERNDFCSKTS
ncbi:uncharacterized protein LOC144105500 [Amblyomma americanum]